jgi:cellulose synthase/poly-beta-1,6-N-acetylglucosamine synthase-like glycosyltransferase
MNISILVPHKNSLTKVCRLLESISSDIPVVLVDDYSDNEVFEELNEVVTEKYSNVKLIRNSSLERNAGTARNVAMKNCPIDTEWVIFADADDKFNKVALNRLVSYLGNNESDDVVFFNCLARKEHSKEESDRCDKYRGLISSWPSSRRSIAFKWPVPWGKAIRIDRVIRPNALEFASRFAGNDMEFSAKLALTHSVINIFSENVYVCYESQNSLTATLTPQKALDRLKANINCNRLYYSGGIEFIRYNYALTFFLKAFPLIVRRKEFFLFKDELKNLFIAFRMNFLVKSGSSKN